MCGIMSIFSEVQFFFISLFSIIFKVALTKLKMDKDRRAMIERKAAGRARITGLLKGKHTEETIADEKNV